MNFDMESIFKTSEKTLFIILLFPLVFGSAIARRLSFALFYFSSNPVLSSLFFSLYSVLFPSFHSVFDCVDYIKASSLHKCFKFYPVFILSEFFSFFYISVLCKFLCLYSCFYCLPVSAILFSVYVSLGFFLSFRWVQGNCRLRMTNWSEAEAHHFRPGQFRIHFCFKNRRNFTWKRSLAGNQLLSSLNVSR